MKALTSSAGAGSRRRPAARTVAKPPVSVHGRSAPGEGTVGSGRRAGPFTGMTGHGAPADGGTAYSVVLRGASIQGERRIEASLIGHDVEVTPSPRVPRAYRFVLGDHSKVQISS